MESMRYAVFRMIQIGSFANGPGHAKMCLMSYANNKGADQPAHPHSLISAFVVAAWTV